MARNVLQVFGHAAVNVTRQVQVEFVFLDLFQAHHAGELGYVDLLGEHVHDLVNVLLTQPVLGAVFHVAAAGVHHEDAFACMRVFFVDDDDAGRDAGAIEQIGRQADDAFDVTVADQVLANVGLGIATEQHTVRQDARGFAGAFERADDVQQVGKVALFGRRHAECFKPAVRVVQRVDAGAPALVRERRVGHHVVKGLEHVLAVQVSFEFGVCQRVALADFCRRVVVQDHVHARQAAGGRVFFLAVERDLGRCFVAHFQKQRA